MANTNVNVNVVAVEVENEACEQTLPEVISKATTSTTEIYLWECGKFTLKSRPKD